MSLVRWEPFREMEDMLRRFSPLMNRPSLGGNSDVATEWTPTANISETAKEYLIKAELPEVKKEDVKIAIENDIITISGERKQEKEHSGENEIRVESFYGTFSRSFGLPDDAETKGVRAESKDGIVTVHIPKREGAKPKGITVKVQ
jgi:HSP20 family protein